MPLAAAVVVAAGEGRRMGGETKKQFLRLGGHPLIWYSLRVLEASPLIKEVVLVVPGGEEEKCRELLSPYKIEKLKKLVPGGKTRQESVFLGLKALSPCELVVVHDGVRPFLSPALLTAVIRAAEESGAAIPCLPPRETVKELGAGVVRATLPRERLALAQTPQAFRFSWLLEAHERARREGFTATDDAALLERLGYAVRIVPGEPQNIKLTTPEDLLFAEAFLKRRVKVRVGSGFDVHRLKEGRRLVLGGVEIPSPRGLEGHSDADVLTHAVMDALLGAAGAGDLGKHFPPEDPAYKDASSLKLLGRVKELLKAKGLEVENIDATVVAESPRLAPYREEMEKSLAQALEVPPERVNVKATTTEGLGFTGERLGIAAFATALLKEHSA